MSDPIRNLQVKLFADGADQDGIARLVKNPLMRGFTTNPTLMRAAKVTDYREFALQGLELIWASPRELLNVFQADAVGCHVITVSHDLLGKLNLVGKDLDAFSLDTVKMFYQDAQKAGYRIEVLQPVTLSRE